MVAAHLPVQRADRKSVRAEQRHQKDLHQAPARCKAAARSASRVAAGAPAAGGKARTTTRHPAGSRFTCDRIRWRSWRLTRLRTTADPTARLTTKPTSGSLRRVASGSTCTTRCVRPAVEPRRTVVEKSSLVRMRWTAVSKTAQAESFERPLRRRLAKMARPARVRMRRRKPCLRARRRLFGWYVRLLTGASSRRWWTHLRRPLPSPGVVRREAPGPCLGNELSTATARSQIYAL